MAGKQAAHRYAKALLALATQEKKVETVDEDMRLIHQTAAESKDLRVMLKSPVVKDHLKLACLKAIFKDIDSQSARLFNVLLENKRIDLLFEVTESFMALVDARNQVSVAEVTTAAPLTEKMRNRVLDKVKAITGQKADLKERIDEQLIGGFLLRIGDLQYDASIAGKLNQLRHNFKRNA